MLILEVSNTYNTQIENISYIFVITASGSITGDITAAFYMEKIASKLKFDSWLFIGILRLVYSILVVI